MRSYQNNHNRMEMWTKSWKHGHFASCVYYKGVLYLSPGITLFFKHYSTIAVKYCQFYREKSETSFRFTL